ncbi:hypothetical protein [Thalassobellus citreus]
MKIFILVFKMLPFGQQEYDNGKTGIEYFSSEKISNVNVEG